MVSSNLKHGIVIIIGLTCIIGLIIAYKESKKEQYSEYKTIRSQLLYPLSSPSPMLLPNVEQDYIPLFNYYPSETQQQTYTEPNMDRWKQNAEQICSQYNTGLVPKSVQDCPDSSFSYADQTILQKYIKGAQVGGCIQLGESSQPNCYSDNEGKYKPWFDRLKTRSP